MEACSVPIPMDTLANSVDYLTVILVAVGLCAVTVLFVERGSASDPDSQKVDALVDRRYDGLLQPLHKGFVFIGIVCIAVRSTSVSTSNSLAFGQETSIAAPTMVALAIFGFSFVMTHFVTFAFDASRRVRAYRTCYLVGDIAFRFTRILDFFSAPDRAAFVRLTAATIAESNMSTYACLFSGWVMGMLQPTDPLERLLFVILVLFSQLTPATIGSVVTGIDEWMVSTVRVIVLPTCIGYVLEGVQRHVVKRVLSSAVHNELAIGLPATPEGSVGRVLSGAAVPSDAAAAADASSGAASQLSLLDFEPVGVLGFGSSAQVRRMPNRRSSKRVLTSPTSPTHGRCD